MKGHDVLLVAGGLGIAPLKSLINHIHDERHDFGRVTILLGARNPSEILFREQFDMWKHREDFDLIMTVDSARRVAGTARSGWSRGCSTGSTSTRTAPSARSADLPSCTATSSTRCAAKDMDADRIYVSFERRMKCGIGKCGHCGVGHQYACIDGPVFNYWEAMNLQEAI